MTLADSLLKELDNPSLTADERALIRCRVAADLIHRGQYETAREALGELWLGIGQRPAARNLPTAVDAEVMLQCGALAGWLGAFSANLVSAGVRLVPLGQTDGQMATAALIPVVEEAAEAALAADLDRLGTAAPVLDLLSMRHETQYTRLFRS